MLFFVTTSGSYALFCTKSLKSHIILQAYYWPYIKNKAVRSPKCNKNTHHTCQKLLGSFDRGMSV